MSQVIDKLERGENGERTYQKDIAQEETQSCFVFIPRYIKYVIPAIEITLGAIGVIGIVVALFA